MYKIILLSLLLIFTACSSKKPGVKIENELWPYELYQKFNLRTVVSSYSNHLQYYCLSYPKDFFRPDQVYMPNTQKIVMRNETRILSFELISKDGIIIRDEVEGTYKAAHYHKIYYNEEADDYRVDLFYIEQSKDCVKFVIPNEQNVSK